MERPIKFRGKQFNTGQWIYGGGVVTLPNGKCAMLHLDYRNCLAATIVQPETVGQFIGLKDKNGMGIYQGDYLKVQADEDGYGSTSYGGIVEVTSETCGFSLKPVKPTLQEREDNGQPWDSSSLWHIDDPKNIEVIGTIHDNPELLKTN